MIPTSLRDQVEALQNDLVAHATGGSADSASYVQLRGVLLADAIVGPRLPSYVRTCGGLDQFWQFIKQKLPSYAERRRFIWDGFQPILDHLDGLSGAPSDKGVSEALQVFDREHVLSAWHKAVDRRGSDPEGAITAARTLLETVCKHILDGSGVTYQANTDLPKLYRLTAEQIQLAPSQHTEQIFRQILGGCQAVVDGLAAARNKLSDSHGQGKKPVKPSPRHAELAVNLAGSMSVFLATTWVARREPAS